jgi:hypothetical protein
MENQTVSDFNDSGLLFKNLDKKSDKHPDYRGELDFTCEHCGAHSHRTLGAWLRVARNGSKFLSLSFKPRDSSSRRSAMPPADAEPL